MTEIKIENSSNEYPGASKCDNVQLVPAMAELQLKYLFYVLENGLEKDFEKAFKGYTSIVSIIQKIPSVKETDKDWQSALKSIRENYSKFSCRADRTGFARESMKIIAPFLSYSAQTPKAAHEWFGCFRYNYDPGMKHVYLHFQNACIPESPFTSTSDRVRELAAIVKDIQAKGILPETIGCESWLNELNVFQSFFPPEYHQSFIVSPPDSKGGYGWWGQFVGKDGRFNKSKAEKFEKTMTFQFQRIIAKCSYAAFVKHILAGS